MIRILAQKLKLRVIAEGVETHAQAQFLEQNHCHEIQGYYFSRPVEAVAFEKLLKQKVIKPQEFIEAVEPALPPQDIPQLKKPPKRLNQEVGNVLSIQEKRRKK